MGSPGRKKKKDGHIFVVIVALALAGALILILMQKPTSKRLAVIVTNEPSAAPPAGGGAVPAPPRLKRLPIPAMELLPGGATAGVQFKDGTALAALAEAFGLQPGAVFSEMLTETDASGALALYTDEHGGLSFRGVLMFSDAEKAAGFADSAGKNQIRAGPFVLTARAEGKAVALGTGDTPPRLISPDTLKPVRRLSQDRSVQAAAGASYDSFLFLSPVALASFLEARFPVKEGDRKYEDILKGLALNKTRSLVLGVSRGGGWELRTDRTRDEGLAGLPSDAAIACDTADCFPGDTLLFAAQAADLPRFLRTMNGLLTFCAPGERTRLPADLEYVFVSWGISPGFLLRLFSGEISFGVWFEGVFPAAAMVADVSDPKLAADMFAVLSGQELVERTRFGELTVWRFRKPLFALSLGAGFAYTVQPCITLTGGRLVAAADMKSLRAVLRVIDGKAPSLSSRGEFASAEAKAGEFSSLVFLRTSEVVARINAVLSSAGAGVSLPEGLGGPHVWTAFSGERGALRIKSDFPFVSPFVNYLVRPEWLPVAASLSGMYDRLLTMLLRAANWGLRRLSYYDIRSLDITLDLRREPWAMECTLELETLVENSTGYTFLLNPQYEIESVTLDGGKAAWKRRGPFLSVRSPRLLGKGEVNRLKIRARGVPEDMLLSLPPALTALFHFTAHSVREPGLVHLGPSALFYPMQPALVPDLWPSRTKLILPAGWKGIANGKPMSGGTAEAPVWLYECDRPMQTLEVYAGPFDYVADAGDRFTVHHFFEEGSKAPREEAVDLARKCYGFYTRTFGGDYDENPVVVHLRRRRGISHCMAFVTLYGYRPSVLTHELGHLWWGSLVKGDPLTGSLWYEGLTEYSSIMFFRRFYPARGREMLKRALEIWRKAEGRPVRYCDLRVWSPRRGLLGYYKGVAIFAGLEYLLGETGFRKFTRDLAKKGFEFADLKVLWEVITGINPDLNWYVRSAFFGKGAFDIAVKGLDKDENGVQEVVLWSVGLNPWRGPVEVRITTSDGGTALLKGVFGGSGRLYLKYTGKGRITEIVADPDGKIPEYNVGNNRFEGKSKTGGD